VKFESRDIDKVCKRAPQVIENQSTEASIGRGEFNSIRYALCKLPNRCRLNQIIGAERDVKTLLNAAQQIAGIFPDKAKALQSVRFKN